MRKPRQIKKPKIGEGAISPSSVPPVKGPVTSPPFAHGAIPADRDQLPNVRGSDRVTRPVLRMPGPSDDNRDREVLPPICACRRRWSRNLSKKTTPSHAGRKLRQHDSRIGERTEKGIMCRSTRRSPIPMDETGISDARIPFRHNGWIHR